MTHLTPLKRFVVNNTGQAEPDDPVERRKAVKGWHNKLYQGSVPRTFIKKIGRELFVDLEAWEKFLAGNNSEPFKTGPGRPRTK
jgi:hypothetical protein